MEGLYKGKAPMKNRACNREKEKEKGKNILYLDKLESIQEHFILEFNQGVLFLLNCVFLLS